MSDTQGLFRTISHLLDYREDDWTVLQQERETIVHWAPEIIQAFYDTLYANDETRAVFHSGERPKLEKTLSDWIVSIIDGPKDQYFWDHQWYIALLHIQRGTKNLYMLGMMNRVQQLFLSKCLECFAAERAYTVFMAFLRVSGAIASLIAQCYDEVVESSISDGMKKVGVNPALLQRIKSMRVNAMIEEVRGRFGKAS